MRLLIRKDTNKITFAFSNAFQEAKNVVGMKHYQVRKYRAWIHYMAMILLLLLFLMLERKKLQRSIHPLISSRDIKLCFQFYLPDKWDLKNAFIHRLFDNLEAKWADYKQYDHEFS